MSTPSPLLQRSNTHRTPQTPPSGLLPMHTQQPQQAYGTVQPPSARMSPASRYHSNLKVLRRRDPSIISIFDQFSHVCVYHHNGQKWEKHGFEGSMFLFERESYPPYGFYILNRVGMDDYIQRLYPEDDISVHGGYLMLRSYPQFTTARLDAIPPSAAAQDKFSPIYAYNNDGLSSKKKGESQTIGLWTFTTDGREPLMDVMLRLHSFIKKNLPYPDEYRYGPDRPPPPNPHLRAANPNSSPDAPGNTTATSGGTPGMITAGNDDGELSELDKLFAKYLPPPQMSGTNGVAGGGTMDGSPAPGVGFGPSSVVGFGGGTNAARTSTASMAVQSLFTALGGTDLDPPSIQPRRALHPTSVQPQALPQNTNSIQLQHQAAPSTPGQIQAPSTSTTTGLSLLNSIFASASGATPPPIQSFKQTPQQQHTHKSKTAKAPLFPSPSHHPQPQVLSQNVIGSLLGLGLGGSEGGSGGEEGEGEESPTHPSSRDGDNELEMDDGSHGSNSSSSDGSGGGGGVFARGLPASHPQQGGGIGQGKQKNMTSATEQAFRNLGIPIPGAGSSSGSSGAGVGGDMTPRPGYLGSDQLKGLTNTNTNHTTRGSSTTSVSSTSTLTTPSKKANGNKSSTPPSSSTKKARDSGGNHRALVPFEPNSELWPYHRHPIDMHDVNENENDDESGAGDGEIVELDWEDMSVLSDLKEFERVRKKQASAKNKAKVASKAPVQAQPMSEGAAVGVEVPAVGTGGRKKKEKKKNKKERLEANAKEREEIENSWDIPTTTRVPPPPPGMKNGNGSLDNPAMMNLNGKNVPIPVTFHDDSPPASPSPVPSPVIPSSPAMGVVQPQSYYDDPRGYGQQQQSQEEEGEREGGAQVDDNITSVSSPSVNGSATTTTTTKKRNRKRKNGGKDKNVAIPLAEVGMNGVEEGKAMKSLLGALEEQKSAGNALEKDVFVREVLKLMEDDSFVEDLWRGYCEIGDEEDA